MTGETQVREGPEAAKPPRRHDLDALRGFAMVLGIGLHALLSFIPGFWPAQDGTASFEGPYDEILHAIHGFRMPLFFLLSGFFTAMLWRKRGLRELLWHRFRRIALPLALGMAIIVPAVNAASEWAVGNQVTDYLDASGDIWTAAYLGNERAVEELLERGVPPDALNDDQVSALHVAAVVGAADVAEALLEFGAEPNIASPEGTPIDFAVYFGNREVAEALVAAGAPDYRPAGGDWDDIDFWDLGGEPLTSDDEVGVTSWLSNFFHLWFLWFLLWLIGGFALIALAVDRFGKDRDHPAAWTGWLMWALIPLTLIPQLAMGGYGANPTFGPETSTGLIPIPHVLAYYAVFFAFGALLFGRRSRDRDRMLVDRIGGWWIGLLPTAILLLYPVGLLLTFDIVDRSWRIASIVQVAYAWAMIFGLMALFRALLARERRGIRYLSDSSYWLYLAHVPLLVMLQSLIRHWDLPSGVKFVGLTAVATLLLLATYQLFVRYTAIGTLLNGKRVRPTAS